MKKSLSEEPKCNFCGSTEYSVVYDGLTYWEYPGIFRIVNCRSCGLVFTSPRPVLSEMEKYYEQENYFGNDFAVDTQKDDATEREVTYKPTYRAILKIKKKGSILDIGAGTGVFLSKFKDEGWTVDGIELATEAVRYAKKHFGISLKKGDFLQYSFSKNSFDVIALNGALEHLHQPMQTLEKSFSILKKGGLIIFSVPNEKSIGRSLFGRDWFPWQPPRHLYHFSPKTISPMLKKAGFSDIHIDHNYYLQNEYILFQSLRYSKSQKFQKSKEGGLKKKSHAGKKSTSPKVMIGKVVGKVFSEGMSRIEPLIGRGEVMLVYARKN